jgi:RimJ/RimL family protein N-acetyltransferase
MGLRRTLARLAEARPTTFSFENRSSQPLLFWLEPWADEFTVPPGGQLELVLTGSFERPAEAPFEWTDEHLVFFAPGGSLVEVRLDGVPQDSGSSEMQVPNSGSLGTRGFVHAVFDNYPEARVAGAPAEETDDLAPLAEGMAEGDLRLHPLDEEHREALKAACAQDPDIWQIYATPYGPEHFDGSFDLLLSRPNWCCFAIFSGERVVGMSCFIGIDAERGVLEIGNTYYIPEMRGTGFNARVKKLMLDRAFSCSFRRVEFRVDARNGRSQAAMAKIGGVREGVLRADRITWTGYVRDTVLFSILAEEWRSGSDPG